jgi:hypothetical protein
MPCHIDALQIWPLGASACTIHSLTCSAKQAEQLPELYRLPVVDFEPSLLRRGLVGRVLYISVDGFGNTLLAFFLGFPGQTFRQDLGQQMVEADT